MRYNVTDKKRVEILN